MLLALLLALAPPQEPRDPFVAYDASPAVVEGPLTAPLHKLKVEGVVAGTAAPRALIRTPDGKSHVARIGDPIGIRLGRIAAIRAGRVVVREAYRDAWGVTRYETITLTTR